MPGRSGAEGGGGGNGQVRRRDVAEAGLDPNPLYPLVERGDVEGLGRGLYRIQGMVPREHEALAEVAHLTLRVMNG